MFSSVTKPNFDLNNFAEKLNTLAGQNTSRTVANSTSLELRNNIKSDISEEMLSQMVKSFKPRSSLFKDVDFSTFKIKKYKNGVYFGQLTEEDSEGIQSKCGKGCVFYNNGRLYEGEFKDDMKHGKGFELYPDSSFYEGDFAGGQKAGRGRFLWNNGEIYDGEWQQGKKHGSGMWSGTDGSKESYIG